MPKITKPGIYNDFDTAAYYADPCPEPSLSQSLCKTLLDYSPAHARLEHPRLAPAREIDEEPEKYLAAQAIGNASHLMLLGRGKELAIGKFDNWRTKDAQAFKAEHSDAGKTVILEKHFDRAAAMMKAARTQLDNAGLTTAFIQGHGEVVITAQEGETWLRSLVDWMVNPTLLYDLKTSAASFAPHQIQFKIEADGWDVQAAMQERILDLIDPENAGRRTFRFIAQENFEPFALVAVEMTEHWLTMGRKKIDMALAIWRDCMKRGTWPAYPAVLHRPEYPQFRETRWLDREQNILNAG